MKQIVLLFGGTSEEKLVSTATAQNVVRFLENPECWFIDPDGAVHLVAKKELVEHQNPFTQILKPLNPHFSTNLVDALPRLEGKTVFMGFHGTEGEDGHIQKIFEQNNISYTGSGSAASDLCFNKLKTKKKAASVGLPLAAEIELPAGRSENQEKLKKFFHEKKKLAMKPVANGSSVGLHIIHDEITLQKAIRELQTTRFDYMAEEFIAGREFTVGVVQKGKELIVLPASEAITSKDTVFDYEGKYLGRGTTEVTPAHVTSNEMKSLQDLALKAHQSFGCYGYSRTDVFMKADGHLVFIETNTLPGLTKASFYPQQLEAANIPFATFIQEMIRLAESR